MNDNRKKNLISSTAQLSSSYRTGLRNLSSDFLKEGQKLSLFVYRISMFLYLSVPKFLIFLFLLHSSQMIHSILLIPFSHIPVVTSCINEFNKFIFILILLHSFFTRNHTSSTVCILHNLKPNYKRFFFPSYNIVSSFCL